VESTGLYEEHIALLYRNTVHAVKESILLDSPAEVLARYSVLKSVDKLSALFAVNDVPHFGLAVFALNAESVFIIGMHLNREVIPCIYEFYKHRKVFKAAAVLTESLGMSLRKFSKCHTGEFTGSDDALTVLMAAELPAFGKSFKIAYLAVFLPESCTAPDIVLDRRFEFKWFHISSVNVFYANTYTYIILQIRKIVNTFQAKKVQDDLLHFYCFSCFQVVLLFAQRHFKIAAGEREEAELLCSGVDKSVLLIPSSQN